ncbi:hypothetical protein Calkr_2123 [Caldicellulosiruptor acetigenus I77R1B]|uniref:Uncharacterized protein n=1 Tax=Caldicellulosiruptor acetigenus (strain ATCC 700853 / DSM 12137 / I77R1B) TaxID=632335 RepID=E4S5S9_CALA7|nr:hypothetical protein [Caldicellulosiruptor acetigenus]ADQ41589.1 hypothetical protein Calkr_2123 [Caldicellulosiruptor acetigenus I77R1B]
MQNLKCRCIIKSIGKLQKECVYRNVKIGAKLPWLLDQGFLVCFDVLRKLDELGVFRLLGEDKTLEFVQWLCEYTEEEYDTNPGEILYGLGAKLKICYMCLQRKDNVDQDSMCKECSDKYAPPRRK